MFDYHGDNTERGGVCVSSAKRGQPPCLARMYVLLVCVFVCVCVCVCVCECV